MKTKTDVAVTQTGMSEWRETHSQGTCRALDQEMVAEKCPKILEKQWSNTKRGKSLSLGVEEEGQEDRRAFRRQTTPAMEARGQKSAPCALTCQHIRFSTKKSGGAWRHILMVWNVVAIDGKSNL